jgi:hypothetical protein
MRDVIMSHAIPSGAEGPVRHHTIFASVNAANGSIPAACALLFVGRKVLR